MKRVFLVMIAIASAWGQSAALERVKAEAAKAKELSTKDDRPGHAVLLRGVHSALRDWFEPRLLRGHETSEGDFRRLESELNEAIKTAGLEAPETADNDDVMFGPGIGYVWLEFKFLPELPNAIFVVAGATVECGADEAIYMYAFDDSGRRRVFEDHPTGDWAHSAGRMELSGPDAQGRRLLATRSTSAQCQSFWMAMAYSVYRLDQAGRAEKLLSEDHGFWFNDDEQFVLKSDELIVEFRDTSVDLGIHNRTNIRRYKFTDGAQRIDPVALQPQDFMEEWLTSAWTEMASRSNEATKEWHDRLHGDNVQGDYVGIGACADRPSEWLIDIELEKKGVVYFAVRELGQYRYRMESVTQLPPKGCVGVAGWASDKHPVLSAAELRALP